MNDHRQQQTEGVYGEVALASLDVLARDVLAGVKAVGPPFCGVFTDWLSRIAAEGVGSRPSLTRTCSRRASWTLSIKPPSRQRRKWSHTSAWGGKSWGR